MRYFQIIYVNRNRLICILEAINPATHAKKYVVSKLLRCFTCTQQNPDNIVVIKIAISGTM